MIAERADETWWISAWERNGYDQMDSCIKNQRRTHSELAASLKVRYHYISASPSLKTLRGVTMYKKLRDRAMLPFLLDAKIVKLPAIASATSTTPAIAAKP